VPRVQIRPEIFVSLRVRGRHIWDIALSPRPDTVSTV